MPGRTVTTEPDLAACSWSCREFRLRRAGCCGVAGSAQLWFHTALLHAAHSPILIHKFLPARCKSFIHSFTRCRQLPAAGEPWNALGAVRFAGGGAQCRALWQRPARLTALRVPSTAQCLVRCFLQSTGTRAASRSNLKLVTPAGCGCAGLTSSTGAHLQDPGLAATALVVPPVRGTACTWADTGQCCGPSRSSAQKQAACLACYGQTDPDTSRHRP